EQVTQLVSADLQAVGIKTNLKYIPSSTYFADDGYLAKRQHWMAEYAWGLDPDPGGGLYDSALIPSEANNYSGQNYPGYKNDRFDTLSRAAANEIEQAKRFPMFAEMQAIWTEDLPAIPLYVRSNISVHK